MNEIMTFNNAEFGSVRTIMMNGEPWFVGKDVATVLGYSNTRDAISKHIDDEDKGVAKCDTLGGSQDLMFINESGLYSLILSSKKSNAKKFKRWVTSEVLPSIRKTGSYSIIQKDSYLIDDPIKRAEKWIEEEKERQALKQKVIEQKPKAEYYDELVDREHLTGIRDTAKELGIKERIFINWLVDNKYLYRDAKKVLKPYSTRLDLFAEKDFKSSHSKHTGVRTFVTLKGKDTFRKLCADLRKENV